MLFAVAEQLVFLSLSFALFTTILNPIMQLLITWSELVRIRHSSALSPCFQPARVNVCYWKELEQKHGIKQGCPAFIVDIGGKEGHFYAIPSVEYPGFMKVSRFFSTTDYL